MDADGRASLLRGGLLLLALALLACQSGPPPAASFPTGEGLPGVLQGELAACAEQGPTLRSWCAVSALDRQEPVMGAEEAWLRVCGDLDDAAATDACVERLMARAPALEASACELIRPGRIQWSCRLLVADRTLPGLEDAGEVAPLCASTGPLLPHCLTHFTELWTPRWQERGYGAFMADVGTVLDAVSGAAAFEELGSGVGIAGALLGAPLDGGPCDFFDDGPAREVCRGRVVQAPASMPSPEGAAAPDGP